ncbi:30S ribosomal protein S19e [Methanohalophilus portucalensis]|uniref:Small ribosomal subunit protein eS19 n=2 Tax=Methanohalophilus portucalensis TaxID=39664 RepID=A0A1L9C423_9EURY|nr:30S ribosomal protein S19e [Methanohalophilus portucalensis]ATU07956.1 30S ribosomal protein S19e [Methanohalophilus portucalensis]OJH49201.1 30S ribosomal protein S19E [Methanohalophilus portucalensis FDF-1]RNI11673.1 30S ribosomal protein S19e [Methanohalophilus portucalensis FDF-1]SMH42499.1 SSU ribosomal protein S19E [Methanohalophilus portucalensis FDF-1]
MTTAYDVPANDIIKKTAEKLKENDKIQPPEWAAYVKTGAHRELPPVEDDWWYTRCAAVLRRIYTDGPVGVQRLRSIYGGKKAKRVTPAKKAKGSGAVARTIAQQLEDAGFVKKQKAGRVASPAGKSLLDNTANEIKKELVSEIPEMQKY